MSEFKVGDKVRVLSNGCGAFNNLEKRDFIVGDIDIITEIKSYYSIRLGYGSSNWIIGCDIEKVTYTNVDS